MQNINMVITKKFKYKSKYKSLSFGEKLSQAQWVFNGSVVSWPITGSNLTRLTPRITPRPCIYIGPWITPHSALIRRKLYKCIASSTLHSSLQKPEFISVLSNFKPFWWHRVETDPQKGYRQQGRIIGT